MLTEKMSEILVKLQNLQKKMIEFGNCGMSVDFINYKDGNVAIHVTVLGSRGLVHFGHTNNVALYSFWSDSHNDRVYHEIEVKVNNIIKRRIHGTKE